MKVYPKRYQSYSLEEICNVLYLRDGPGLGFTFNGIDGCVQDSHLTVEELLSVPGFKDTQWVYIRETHEWIPVFRYNEKINQPSIDNFCDLEIYEDKYRLNKPNEKFWWCTPKGFPRPQDE